MMFDDIVLFIGEEVEILKGLESRVLFDPIKVTVAEEYPNFFLLNMFHKVPGKQKPVVTRICAEKTAMFCGDIVLQRKSDKEILTGATVGRLIVSGGACR